MKVFVLHTSNSSTHYWVSDGNSPYSGSSTSSSSSALCVYSNLEAALKARELFGGVVSEVGMLNEVTLEDLNERQIRSRSDFSLVNSGKGKAKFWLEWSPNIKHTRGYCWRNSKIEDITHSELKL